MPLKNSKEKPGEKALQAAKQYDVLETFVKPLSPLAKKKSKQAKILDEDSYIQGLDKIIQRDFFPDLEKLKAQSDYLDAIEKNDVQKLRELYAKYSSGKRPPTEAYASPATFETPVDVRRGGDAGEPSTPAGGEGDDGFESTKEDGEENSEGKMKERTVTLDQYLSCHTSEDNKSFEDIMEETENKRRLKYHWLFEAEEEHREKQKLSLMLPSIEEQAKSEETKPAMVDSWTYTNRNYIMYVPDGAPLTPEELIEQAKRRQEILHNNTRFGKVPFNEKQNKVTIQELAHSQAKTLEGRIGVDGKELLQATPKLNGYSFMKTPSPAPGVDESPFMTWGEIEGTPFRLDASDTPLPRTPGPSFKMPEVPKRERLAHKLAEKASERHRDKKVRAMEAARAQLPLLQRPSSTSSSPLDRLATLSPAAQRLASVQLRKRIGTDTSLRASYSPGASRTPSASPSHRTPSSRRFLTPGAASPATPGRSRSSRRSDPSSLTDNLLKLNLPKRAKASDFFNS